jgi:hypothetical protein
MFWTKTILVLGLTAFFAQSGDMPRVRVAKQMEEFALKARREGQPGLIPIPPDLFAKVTETISVYPTICDAPHRACLHAYRLPYAYKGSETFAECHGWIEQYQYEDEDGEFSVHDVPASCGSPAPKILPPEPDLVAATCRFNLVSAL